MNAVEKIGSAVSNPEGALNSLGKGFGEMNPFKKPDVPDLPGIEAPKDITAPTMAPGMGPQTVAAPGTFKGGTIAMPGLAQGLDMGGDAFRQHQMALAGQLANQAAGVGPSVAENQFRSAQEANIAAIYGMANSARGGAQPMMARQALQTGAEMQGRLAQDAATARLQEQMQAAGMLNQVAGGARGQDVAIAQANAQIGVENMKAQLQQAVAQGQLDQATAEAIYGAQVQKSLKDADLGQAFQTLQAQYAAMGMDAAKANQAAALQVQQLKQQGAIAQSGMNVQADMNQKQAVGGLFGAGGQGIAAYAALSDERQKTDVKDGDPKIREFLDTLNAHDYEYKDEKFGKGRFVSPMAQELLQSEVGKSMVIDTPHGYAVDYGKGFGALLAAQASLNKRLSSLEKKKAS